ncbi:MAG: T9SS type A sorting domain-containing protein [Bacteroidota bacterium]
MTSPNTVLCQGETLLLTATDIAGAEYTWFWKGDIVEVNNSNTFTAYGEGEWSVSVDYNDICNSQSTLASTNVEYHPYVTSLLRRDDEGLYIEVLDGSTPAAVDWFYNYEPAVAYANQTRINPALPDLQGSYNALVTYQTGCNDDTNLVRFYPEQGTRGSGLTEGSSYLLYPNPNDGRFTLSIPTAWSGTVNFRLVDNLGKSLASFQLKEASQVNEYQFEVQILPKGTYFLEIRTETELFVEKVVKAQ